MSDAQILPGPLAGLRVLELADEGARLVVDDVFPDRREVAIWRGETGRFDHNAVPARPRGSAW